MPGMGEPENLRCRRYATSFRPNVRPSVRSALPDTRGDQASDPADAAPRLGHHFGGKCHLEMRLHSLVAAVGRSVGRSLLPSFVQGRSSGVPGVSPLRSFLLSRRPRPSLQPKSVSIAAANCFPFPTFNDRRVSDRHGHGAAQRGVREIWTLRQPLASSGQACLRERWKLNLERVPRAMRRGGGWTVT